MVVFWNISRETNIINTYKKNRENGVCLKFYKPPITKKELKTFIREVIKETKKTWNQYLWN